MSNIKKLMMVGASGAAPGEAIFTSTGSNTWVCPAGVTSVSVVCIGGGAGGGPGSSFFTGATGGGLGYKNNISVTPGTSYTVQVGAGGGSAASGGDRYFISSATVEGEGGGNGREFDEIWRADHRGNEV